MKKNTIKIFIVATTIVFFVFCPEAIPGAVKIGFFSIVLSMVISSGRHGRPIVIPIFDSGAMFKIFPLSSLERLMFELGIALSVSGLLVIFFMMVSNG